MSSLGKDDMSNLEVLDLAAPPLVMEKPRIADPAPLGLAGLALAVFIYSAYNAGWTQELTWLGVAFFYGGLAQVLAGMWEFKKNNTFGATFFSAYGTFWMSLGLFVILAMIDVLPASLKVDDALGWLTCAFFIFNTYMCACALLTNYAILTIFAFLEISELCLFIGNFSGAIGWVRAGGYFGFMAALAAFYASFANCFNSMVGREVVPVGVPVLTFTKLYTS